MWWIGLGIKVELNTPSVPQQNGTVEGLQDICKRWSSPSAYENMSSYQKRVDKTNHIQREVYRIRSKGDKTRKELYPKLWKNKRIYNADIFSLRKVYENLVTRVWSRKIHKGGHLYFWKKKIHIDKTFAHQEVTITYDLDGKLLKMSTIKTFTEEQILDHAGISKNSI